ncbi:MAG TPA: chromosome segregation protein SMC [Candidatus Limiplasma sp.]|nr:chromosome segregation protein SMC [Candidatus Limiplasma sp.]
MRLSKLEIYGFKSFAKRTEIVFPQNVTGIVGPNGSGKSNIGDAVRWVLGEQSAKTLRGNSMSDVIFNGTQQRKPMNYCEVTLVFDNADRQLHLDYSEVSVTRRVYRSGDSEYLLNGAACRLKDVVDLFRDTGVGKEGYSIIGQGRIDEILSQRSEDRRAVFEEAAGISRFRARKDEAEQRLKRSDENLVRIADVLDELQKQLGPLEKQAEVAREYLALSETLKELDIQLYLVRYDRLGKRFATVRDALSAATLQLTGLTDRVNELNTDREQREQGLEALQQALSAAHDALLAQTDALHRAQEQSQNVENRLQTGTETLSRLQSEADSVQARMRLINATMSQSEGGLDEAEHLRAQAEAALAERRQALTLASETAQKWEDELSAHKTAIIESMTRMQDARTAQARQAAMLKQMAARREELKAALEGGTEKEIALQAALQTAVENLIVESNLLNQRRGEAEALEVRARELAEGLENKRLEAQTLAQSARSDETRLKTLQELQEGYEGYQYPVKQAITYARQKGLSGVHDVVALLLDVPQAYETALDMALGGAMQNIVTDTEQDAKTLIEYLRENRLGRATFLPISSMQGRTLSPAERRVLTMDGCVGVASELCRFEEQYRPVMENLLGRTVIARDLDSGIRIMRAGNHAFRLVTLAGDVMHSGGGMTGGSIRQKAQNLLGREREIKELAASLAEKSESVSAAMQTVADMEAERSTLREKRLAAREAVQQQEIAVARDTERRKNAENELAEHTQSLEDTRQAVEQLDESITGLETELAHTEALTGREQTDAEAMNQKTAALDAELGRARRSREAAQEAQTQAMLALQEAEHTCDRLHRDKRRLQEDHEACRKELDGLAERRNQAQDEVGQAEHDRDSATQAVALAENSVAQAKAHVETAEAGRAEAQRALKDVQNETEAARTLAEKATERQHRQEMSLSRLESEQKALNDRLWDTYELTYAGARDTYAEYRRGRAQDSADAGTSDDGATATAANADSVEEAVTDMPPLPADFDEDAADHSAQEIRDRIRQMGSVNVASIEEYAKLRERVTGLSGQRDDLEHAKRDLETLITELLTHMQTVFVEQFGILQGYFEETFIRLFGGGHGEIRLEDASDPLNCGIEIIVQPPGKKRQILSLFSGGERALTAISILFAMLKLRPTPFCILDEIEAALDEANINYFADYLKEFSKSTQFVVVTHRKGTMERCDTLFGVAMEERGVSSMVSVSLKDYQ